MIVPTPDVVLDKRAPPGVCYEPSGGLRSSAGRKTAQKSREYDRQWREATDPSLRTDEDALVRPVVWATAKAPMFATPSLDAQRRVADLLARCSDLPSR